MSPQTTGGSIRLTLRGLSVKVGDLVRHRVVSLGAGVITNTGHDRSGHKMVYVLWSKHPKLGPNLEMPESLELINESR